MNARLAQPEAPTGGLSRPRSVPGGNAFQRIASILAVAGVIILAIYILAFYSQRSPIRVGPSIIDFAMVSSGGRIAERQATIQNRTGDLLPVTLAWSCDCIDVRPSTFELPPHGEQIVTISLRNPPEPSVDQARIDWDRQVRLTVVGGNWQGWEEFVPVRGCTLRAVQFSPWDTQIRIIEDHMQEDFIPHEIPVGIVQGCSLISVHSQPELPLLGCRFQPDESGPESEPTSGRIVLEIPTEYLSNRNSSEFHLVCVVRETGHDETTTQEMRLTSSVQSAIDALPSIITANQLDVPSIVELRAQSNQVELIDFEVSQSKHCRVRPLSNSTLEVIAGEIPADEQGEVELRVRYRYGNTDSSCVVRIPVLR